MDTSKLSEKPDEMLGDNLRWTNIQSRRSTVAILLVASCCGNRDKLRLSGPLGSCADFTFYLASHNLFTERPLRPARRVVLC